MEEFEFNENANFYQIAEGVDMDIVIGSVFENAVDKNKVGNLYDKRKRWAVGIDGMIYSFLAYKRKMRPACFDKDTTVEDKWYEIKFAYLLIVEYAGYVAVIKKNIPTIRVLRKAVTPIDYNVLCNVLVDDTTVYKKFGIDNLDISDFAIRSKVLEAENLESVFSTIGANNFLLGSLRLTNSEGTFSLAMNQSKINQYNSTKFDFDVVLGWVKKIVDLLIACDGGVISNYLSVFATPVDYLKEYRAGNLNAHSVLVSLYHLYNEGLSHIERCWKEDDEDKSERISVHDLCSVFQYAFSLQDNGEGNYSAPVGEWGVLNVIVSERGISLHGEWMKQVYLYWENNQGTEDHVEENEEKDNLFDYIRDNGLYTVMFNDPILKYSNRKLFKDHRLTGNIDVFLDLFEDDGRLVGMSDEKGKHLSTTDTKFADDTLFGYIEDKFADEESIMVCDDLGTEWADHIRIGEDSVSIFAAKHKNECFSASAFQEVVGQAQKNLGVFFPQESQWKRKLAKWNDVYRLHDVETHIRRIRTDGKTSQEAVDMWKRAERTLNFRRDVYLVVDFISKKKLTDCLIKLKDGVDFREKKEAIPILWLISSLYASCQELHIGLHITCVPGKQEDQK